MDNLLDLFCLKYNSSVIKKRRYLLYFVINIITEKINLSINMINNQDNIKHIQNKTYLINRQITKKQEAPKTDYLLQNFTNKFFKKYCQFRY